jgi:hypothetical protein
MLYGYVPFDSV